MEEAKIRAIQKYLSHNGVKYYDVQAELIDHFATAVEKIERENPGIRFKTALLKAHRSFGGSRAFEKYIREAEKRVEKKTWKLVGQTLLKFLQWPYLMVTVAVAAAWHFVLEAFSESDTFWHITLFGFLGAYLLVILLNWYRLRNLQMFLPRTAVRRLSGILYFVCYLPHIPVASGGTLLVSFAWPYYTLLSLGLVAFYRVPTLAVRETRKLYPQMS